MDYISDDEKPSDLTAVLCQLANVHGEEFMEMSKRSIGAIVILMAREEGGRCIEAGTAILSATQVNLAAIVTMGMRVLEKAAGESLRQAGTMPNALPAPDRTQ